MAGHGVEKRPRGTRPGDGQVGSWSDAGYRDDRLADQRERARRRQPGAVVLVHTDIDPAFEGGGLGRLLVGAALDDIRERGLQVVPLCPFVAAYIRRNPGYADLVVADPAVSD